MSVTPGAMREAAVEHWQSVWTAESPAGAGERRLVSTVEVKGAKEEQEGPREA
jgi:hypothetical protein